MVCFRAGQGLIRVLVISLEGDVVRVFLWSLECNGVIQCAFKLLYKFCGYISWCAEILVKSYR